MKRAMDIEAALCWAYQRELPKSHAGKELPLPMLAPGSSGLDRLHRLGTDIDTTPNDYGVMVDYAAREEPAPDALVIADAVSRLDACEVTVHDGWDPFEDIVLPDIKVLTESAVTRAAAVMKPVDQHGHPRPPASAAMLVQRHAMLGSAPDWVCDPMTVKVRRGPQGGPLWFVDVTMAGERGSSYTIKVDGWDARRRVPKPGAYQERYLDPDPYLCALGRAEYEVWVSALGLLFDDLCGRMTVLDLTPSLRPLRPWMTGEAAPAILPDTMRPPPAKKIRRGSCVRP